MQENNVNIFFQKHMYQYLSTLREKRYCQNKTLQPELFLKSSSSANFPTLIKKISPKTQLLYFIGHPGIVL